MSKHSSGVQRDEKERKIESEERQGGKRDSARVYETTSDPGVAVGVGGGGEVGEGGEQKSFWKRRKGKKFACTGFACFSSSKRTKTNVMKRVTVCI